mmetsp:Transcript_14408/g.26956  ORF Transcript_14408/g.26956 Transcript_14408/m.26956 type:complete len:574 (-) Transcript_14408:1479-3200(-)
MQIKQELQPRTTKPSECFSALPEDVWGEVFSFFTDDHVIAELLLLSKQIYHILHDFTYIGLRICRFQIKDWGLVREWLEKFRRVSFIDIASTNCNSQAIRDIVQLYNAPTKHPPTLSITKCFALNDEFVDYVVNYENIALCDLYLPRPLPLHFFSDLRTLMLSNCTFSSGSLQHLFENFPSSLTFVAFGGTRNLFHSFDPTHVGRSNTILGCSRDDLCIEATFKTDNSQDIDFLRAMFPRATFINLVTDSVQHLVSALEKFPLRKKALSRALVSCHEKDSTGSTPLHIACREGDVERCHFLMSLNGRNDLKDYKGCIPLHRATMTMPILNLEPLVSNIQSRIESESHPNNTEEDTAKKENKEDTTNIEHLSLEEPVAKSYVDIMHDEDLPQPTWPLPGSYHHSAWQCAVLCLQAGASCFVKNQSLQTPLLIAAERGNDIVLYSMVTHLRMLADRGEDLMIDEKCSDEKGFTPLQAAILAQSLCSVQILLVAGCCPNRSNRFGSTAMHLAYRSNVAEIIKVIKEAGGRLDIQDSSGDLPESYAPEVRQAKMRERSKKKSHYHKGKGKKKKGGVN